MNNREEPAFINISDIDISNTVFFEVTNPLYKGDECNIAEFCFEFPEERIKIIQLVKMVVRCGLEFKYYSHNKKAENWVTEYYEMYRS